MAKKKNVPVAVEAPASGGEVAASDLSAEAHIASLKDLNQLLLKGTVELREQNKNLRAELATLAADPDILNETERDVCRIVLSSNISDAAARSTADMASAAETAGKMTKKAESAAAELNAAEIRVAVVAREKDMVERDLERVTEERDLSRSHLDEKCKVYADLEEKFRLLKQELAEMAKQREAADARCAKLEEEGRRMKGELRSAMREKDLLKVTIGQLENEAGDLKVSLEEVKKENLSLVARYEESEKRYSRVEKDFNRNSIKYACFEKEKLELEKTFDIKEKKMALQIKELNEKMRMMEGEKNLVEIQISSFQEEILNLQSARKSLEDAHSSCCEKIAMKELYCADMQKEKNLKAEEIVSLQMQLNESSKKQHMSEITIEELLRKLNHVTAENEKAKKQINCSIVEKASLKKQLETSNQGLQDVQKKLKALEDSSGQVFALLKKMIAEVIEEERTQENHISKDVVEVENDEEMKLFVDNLEAIKLEVKGKETIIKDLNQKLELLQLSVAHAKNKRSIWRWWLLFPATTGIFAAAFLAYAARAR